MDMLDKVTIADLDDDDKALAELVGLECFIKLVRAYGGGYLYLKKIDTIARNVRDEEIRQKFSGNNYYELAKEYNLSEKMVRNIIGAANMKKFQISLFDD